MNELENLLTKPLVVKCKYIIHESVSLNLY